MEPTQDNQVTPQAPRPGALVMPSEPVIASPAEATPVDAPAMVASPVTPPDSVDAVEQAEPETDIVQAQDASEDAPADAEDHGVDLEDLDNEEQVEEDVVDEEPAFQWQASEFVQHHKGMGWYLGLVGVVVLLIGVAVYTHQWLSIAVFLAMAAAIVVYAHKPPRTLMYMLDSEGISIDGKEYGYDQFRSFAVLQDESWHAIDLEPTQRFMPRLTVIFDSEDLDGITEHLSLHLPRADRQPDLVERITRYLRF